MNRPVDSPLTYRVMTWGCQMNVHDSERLAGLMEGIGYRESPAPDAADVYLLNTCSVRAKAEEKVMSALGRLRGLKEQDPSRLIGVCGCVAQQEGRRLIERAPYVDFVLGPRRLDRLPEIIQLVRSTGAPLVDVSMEEAAAGHDGSGAQAVRASRHKAFVTIMEGCENFCSYCVVPFTRGPERSRSRREVLDEVAALVKDGCVEVTLLGQNVNSFTGQEEGTAAFPRLLRDLDGLDGLRRIRFVTSHPKDFGDQLIRAMADSESVCENIHLPVQAGSDRVLGLMNRGYRAQEYLDKLARLREAIPEVAISTDMIVGFPGETEAEFEETLELVRRARFDSMYAFAYSPRPGTAAAELPGELPRRESLARLHRLQEVQNGIGLEKNRALLGRSVEVLVDANVDGSASGRTRDNRVVHVRGTSAEVGSLVSVEVIEAGAHSLVAGACPEVRGR